MTDATNEVVVDDRDVTLVVIAFLALIATVGVLAVCLILIVGQSHAIRDQAVRLEDQQQQLQVQAKQSEQDHKANCSYLANLKQQERSGRKYLKQHPDGAPALGISAAQIRASVHREEAAVKSLSDLNCSK